MSKDAQGTKTGQDSQSCQARWRGSEGRTLSSCGKGIFALLPVKPFLPGQHVSPNSKLPCQEGFIFCHAFWPHFCKGRNHNHHNNPMCYHQFNVNGLWGVKCFAFRFGGTPRSFCPHQGTKSSWWASPQMREAFGSDSAWEREREGDSITRRSCHCLCAPLYPGLWEGHHSCWKWYKMASWHILLLFIFEPLE